ncbi:eukaryotic translation initiation factor 4E transporter-like isoform X2 [Lineus longissimus]|uniref:eukaryotic translation initiation factor 4E transporter-like isoform X2 n=1 Tax=Lineus longissimus TaxID=88925 RepID=UPI00315D84D7
MMDRGDQDDPNLEAEKENIPVDDGGVEKAGTLLPQHFYTKDELFEMAENPASKKRPTALLKDFDTAEGYWDPEKWIKSFDNSRSNSPMFGGELRKRRSDLERDGCSKRSSSDPRERLKEERDGIVLSPQRKSFMTGCHVSQAQQQKRAGSPTEHRDQTDRERRDVQRRIGSGRIPHDRDREHHDYRNDRFDERDRRFERNDRFRREEDRDRDNRERDSNRIQREYGCRRFSGTRRPNRASIEEEPEWFTGGPHSQSDTIELRGFEDESSQDGDDYREDDHGETNRQRASCVHLEQSDMQEDQETLQSAPRQLLQRAHTIQQQPPPLALRSYPAHYPGQQQAQPPQLYPPVIVEAPSQHSPQTQEFNFDEFFNIDTIPGLDVSAIAPEDEALQPIGSRFSRWFCSQTSSGGAGSRHSSRNASRRSSITEDFNFLNEILGGQKSPGVPSPNDGILDPQHMFSPIPTSADRKQQTILDMLQQSRVNVQPLLNSVVNNNKVDNQLQRKDIGYCAPLKVKTLAELEANLQDSGHVASPKPQAPPPPPQVMQKPDLDNDMSAFNKLVGMMVATGNLPDGVKESPPPMRTGPPLQHPPTTILPPDKNGDTPTPTQNQQQQLNIFQELLLSQQQHQQQQIHQKQLQEQQQQQKVQEQQQQKFQEQQQHQKFQEQHQQQRLQEQKIQQALQQQLQVKLMQHQQQQQLQQQKEKMMNRTPTIVTKPASPPLMQLLPNPQPQPTTPRIASPNILQQALQLQQASTSRAPSPIMFGQQPPMHLNAPSPIHPSGQASPSKTPVAQQNLSVNTLQVNSGSRSPVLARVPSPQELVYHTQAIMQNALIKKQLEDQKERFMKKQQQDIRAKSPNPVPMTISSGNVSVSVPVPTMSIAAIPTVTEMTQMQMQTSISQMHMQTSVSTPVSAKPPPTVFTPTSVIIKMASDKAGKDRETSESTDSPMQRFSEQMASPSRRSNQMGGQTGSPQHSVKQARPLFGQGAVAATAPQTPTTTCPLTPNLQQSHSHGRPIVKVSAMNQMNQINQFNQLAALQAQARGVDPRLQVRGVYTGMVAQGMQGGRGLVPSNMSTLGVPQAALSRSLSPQPPFPPPMLAQAKMGNGPLSPIPSYPKSASPNPGADLSKWFQMDMLKQHLPAMPPIPGQGPNVLTVDELERRQQVLTN